MQYIDALKNKKPYTGGEEVYESSYDLTLDIKPIFFYINNHDEMVKQMFKAVGISYIKQILPPKLLDIPMLDLQQACIQELSQLESTTIKNIMTDRKINQTLIHESKNHILLTKNHLLADDNKKEQINSNSLNSHKSVKSTKISSQSPDSCTNNNICYNPNFNKETDASSEKSVSSLEIVPSIHDSDSFLFSSASQESNLRDGTTHLDRKNRKFQKRAKSRKNIDSHDQRIERRNRHSSKSRKKRRSKTRSLSHRSEETPRGAEKMKELEMRARAIKALVKRQNA
ncbi:unnamed protein product [Gordionus sp. m RMFG-2023]|uniref:uncharacterized protein LOC135928283 n=1 Tax=Gordionus sp. m RMFG-2023 TaxID=3053472 RepID=UPI0030E140B5